MSLMLMGTDIMQLNHWTLIGQAPGLHKCLPTSGSCYGLFIKSSQKSLGAYSEQKTPK